MLLLLIGAKVLYGQSPQLPWSTQDGGGGKSAGGDFTLSSSIGQPAAGTTAGTNFTLEGGYLPGSRSLSGTTSILDITMGTAWNLISLPVLPEVLSKSVLFPTATSNAFAYYPPPTGYAAEDTLATGIAYWLKFPSIQSVTFNGTSTNRDTIPVSSGWNMIGSISYPALVSDITTTGKFLILSAAFGFTGGIGYYPEDTLKPGLGYWIKVDNAGGLVIRAASSIEPMVAVTKAEVSKSKETSAEIAARENLSFLSVKDNLGRERILYVSPEDAEIDGGVFELPPPPPSGMFDVRYESQSSLAVVAGEKGKRQEFPIAIAGAEYPLTIKWNGRPGDNTYALEAISSSSKKAERISFADDRSVTLTKGKAVGLKLVAEGMTEKELPKQFALKQNYPNPFNPVTSIAFDLPRTVQVSIIVYNLLGQQVAVLLDNVEKEAGTYNVEFEGEGLPSGLYLYRMQADDFVQTKKMTLLK